MADNLPPVNLGIGKTAKSIATGREHTCALLSDNSVKCWGANSFGQLGLGDTQTRGNAPFEMGDNLPAVNLGIGKNAKAIAAGASHTCAILNDDTVRCWGNNDSGHLGLGDTNNRGDDSNEMGDNLEAVHLGTGKTASAIAGGWYHACAILNDGNLKCWGANLLGQLGLGDIQNRGDSPNEMGDSLPPVNLGAGKTAASITAHLNRTCAVLNDGSVKCWGANSDGTLGLGDTKDRGDGPNEMGDNLPPVDLGAAKTAVGITAGLYHTCVLLHDKSLKCWGRNEFGQLGLGDIESRGDAPGEMGDNLPAVLPW